MEDAVDKLAKKIAWHESEAKRLRSALEVFREMEREGDDSPKVVTNFANGTFMEAVRIILARGPKKTSEIRAALQAGHFHSDMADFRTMVSNRLADAARRDQLAKRGQGKGGVTWSLPASS
jgi:hypothetical protein